MLKKSNSTQAIDLELGLFSGLPPTTQNIYFKDKEMNKIVINITSPTAQVGVEISHQ